MAVQVPRRQRLTLHNQSGLLTGIEFVCVITLYIYIYDGVRRVLGLQGNPQSPLRTSRISVYPTEKQTPNCEQFEVIINPHRYLTRGSGSTFQLLCALYPECTYENRSSVLVYLKYVRPQRTHQHFYLLKTQKKIVQKRGVENSFNKCKFINFSLLIHDTTI